MSSLTRMIHFAAATFFFSRILHSLDCIGFLLPKAGLCPRLDCLPKVFGCWRYSFLPLRWVWMLYIVGCTCNVHTCRGVKFKRWGLFIIACIAFMKRTYWRWIVYMENRLLIQQLRMVPCDIFFSEDDGYMFEKTIMVWKSMDQLHPRCEECVVKDLMKVNYGRPFFVYSEKVKPCSFWVWGDVQLLPKPECHHWFLCVVRKVKEVLNKDLLFFCCSNDKENSCLYFEPVESDHISYQSVNFVKPFQNHPQIAVSE